MSETTDEPTPEVSHGTVWSSAGRMAAALAALVETTAGWSMDGPPRAYITRRDGSRVDFETVTYSVLVKEETEPTAAECAELMKGWLDQALGRASEVPQGGCLIWRLRPRVSFDSGAMSVRARFAVM